MNRIAPAAPEQPPARADNGTSSDHDRSPDGAPAVGPYRERPTVVAALGAGGSGLQSSPALGRIAAEWIVYGESRSIPAGARFVPDRS